MINMNKTSPPDPLSIWRGGKASVVMTLLLLVAFFGMVGGVTRAQERAQEPAPPTAPTLVPPTLVPSSGAGADELVRTESSLQRIINNGRVRIGILYNEPPFGELTVRGEVVGFDADIARAIAEAWGVEPRLRQVTRQTAAEMLDEGTIDLLIAQQVHRRELDQEFEFSQTYYLGSQSMMVRTDDAAQTLADMANRRIGVVQATPAQQALEDWAQRSGIQVSIETFVTLDRAYGALLGGQVDGMVSSVHHLKKISAQQPEGIRILEEPVQLEPYAIAMPRQDFQLRNLINKTLQFLQSQDKLAEISETHFPDTPYGALAVWDGLGEEAPKPAEFEAAITFPTQYTVPRMQSSGVVRVAGIEGVTLDDPDATESQRRMDIFHRNLMNELASRWGVTVEYIAATPEQAIDLVANGEADIALGVEPNWDWANRVDFTSPYLLRGLRLMVKKNSNIFNFTNLAGGRWIAISRDAPEARARAVELANSVNALINIIDVREQDFAFAILEDRNADVAFADSVVLLPYLEQYPDDFQLTDTWYDQTFVSMAVPQNDIDFRLLVDYTLQELVRDGTLSDLLETVMLPEDVPEFDIWPGPSNYLGYQLSR